MVLLCLMAVAAIALRWGLAPVGALRTPAPTRSRRAWTWSLAGVDAWLAVASLLTGVLLVTGNPQGATLGLVAGVSGVVHTLFVCAYLAGTGRTLPKRTRVVWAAVALYTAAFGAVLLLSFWGTAAGAG